MTQPKTTTCLCGAALASTEMLVEELRGVEHQLRTGSVTPSVNAESLTGHAADYIRQIAAELAGTCRRCQARGVVRDAA